MAGTQVDAVGMVECMMSALGGMPPYVVKMMNVAADLIIEQQTAIERLELIVGANKTSHDFTRRKLKAAREALELLDDTLCDEWGPGPWHDTQEAIIATSRAVQEDTNGED